MSTETLLRFTETLERDKVLQLLRRSVPYYLSTWQEFDDGCGLFGTTDPKRFNMRHVNSSSPVIEYVIRPHLHILCVLSAFLSTHTPLQEDASVDAADLFRRGMRFACLTHLTGSRDVAAFMDRKRWGENWRSSLWASMLALAAGIGREWCDEEIRRAVDRILAFEADRFIRCTPPSGCEVDTKLEENALDTLVLAWGLAALPDHAHAPQWREALALWSVNIATCVTDRADHREYFGGSIASQVQTTTLYPDKTAENHAFFHPLIMAYSMWIVMARAAYVFHGRDIPECLGHKRHQETFEILLRFYLPAGLLYEPAGQDLPMFIPRPLALAWGIWNNDPRAHRLTARLLTWMEELTAHYPETGQWVLGLPPCKEGWELFFQSQVGFELALLALLPHEKETRFYTSGQIENAMDTCRIFRYVQLCYRRNTRATRSVAWKAIGGHPVINLAIHSRPELIASFKAGLLGVPSCKEPVRRWKVCYHHDRLVRDGFDTYGRILYTGQDGRELLGREVRVLTWGEEGLVILDRITALHAGTFNEQYLSPVYLVNDYWTGNRLRFHSGSLVETFVATEKKYREISCPSFWASVDNTLLFQFLWGRTKGLIYLPGGERNAPPYWENCRFDMLAVRAEGREVGPGEVAYQVGYFIGDGKGPRAFKSSGTAGPFFKGLVIMDGKSTVGLD